MASSNGQEMPRSMKSLWALLTGSLNIKSMQFIADELQQCQDQLTKGILFYNRHDPVKDSLEELKKRHSSHALTPPILYNLSVFLDIEAGQCYRLFESYIIFEYKGTTESLKSLFSNDKHIRELFENLWHFYYSERLFSLFCLKQIFSNWKSSDHIYSKIFHDFLQNVEIGKADLSKISDQLKYLLSFDFESRSKYGHHFNGDYKQKLKENLLKEQVEILHLHILFFQNFKFSIENVIEMFNIFTQHDFRFAQQRAPQHQSQQSSSLDTLCQYLGFLKTILAVEVLDLSNVHNCQVKKIDHSNFNLKNINKLRTLNDTIASLHNGTVEHGPIYLAWMVLCMLVNEKLQLNEHPTQLGMKAHELGVFDYWHTNLESAPVVSLSGSKVFNSIYTIIANVIGTLSFVSSLENVLANIPSLVKLTIKLYANESVAELVDNNLTSGIVAPLRYALSLFPHKTHFVLSLYRSLSQTNTCKNNLERMCILDNLTSFTESLGEVSPDNYVLLDGETVQLKCDRTFYNDALLLIPKGSVGKVTTSDTGGGSAQYLVKWELKRFDGWRLLHARTRQLIAQIRLGYANEVAVNNETALAEIGKVAAICSNLIALGAHRRGVSVLEDIIRLLLGSFKFMIGLEHSTATPFLAAVLQLAGNIVKTGFLPTKQLWLFISEKEFFPYMIGFSNQLDEVLSGTDTNISTYGHILLSYETITGNYELTFAFLELIGQCARREQFLQEKTVIASFILIARDIFPAHKLWNYRNERDAHKIEQACMQIFYELLNRARKKTKGNILQIEELAILLLMEGAAAEHLLAIIKDGEANVKAVIHASGNDNVLVTNEQIATVRTSLLVLSYLLEIYGQMCEWFPDRPKKRSVIEEKLFSSKSSSPNMLLTFTNFIYQTYDIHLATNAMHLLRQLALQFPMSMLACFGSNTESIRDYLLFRLETVTEDINFKISLLQFLSTCIDHQPGLVEMFLNAPNNELGVLNTIIEILTEKLEGQCFCPFELHQACLEFVSKFWLKLNIIAINLFKSNANFWKLISFPLFVSKTEPFDHSLCGFILKILSREVFYTKMLDKNSLSPQLMAVFDRMKKENVCTRISAEIRDNIVAKLSIGKNEISLIDAWKDFLSSCTKVLSKDIPFELLMSDVKKNLLVLLSNGQNREYLKAINKFANLLLIISNNLETQSMIGGDAAAAANNDNVIVQIFEKISQNMEAISFSAIISLETFLLRMLQKTNKNGLNDSQRRDIFICNCDILYNSLQIITKLLAKGGDSGAAQKTQEKRLVSLTLMNIITTLNRKDASTTKYLLIIRHHKINELAKTILLYLIQHNIHADLAQHLLLYFVALSNHSEGADMLFNLNLINSSIIHYKLPADVFALTTNNNNVAITATNMDKPTPSQQQQQQQPYASTTITLLSLLIRVVINMTIHLRHHFLESSISFLAIYNDIFKTLCGHFRATPRVCLASIMVLVFELCATLSRYIQSWRESHPASLASMTNEILLTSNSIIAFLLRPNILMQSIDPTPSKYPMETSTALAAASQASITKNETCPQFELLQDQLYEILLHSFRFIIDISPNMFDLFEMDTTTMTAATNHSLLLVANFSIPNHDSMAMLTFGAMVSLINNTIKMINKEKNDERTDRKRIAINISLVEYALTILLVQTLIARNSDKLNDGDKQLFFREINSEVNTFKTNLLSKTTKRVSERHCSFSSQPQMLPSPAKTLSGATNLMERKFIKLVFNLLETVIQ